MKAVLVSRTAFVAAALFVFTVATRWPIRFDGFGEKDHPRFLCDVILYGFESGAIFRKYFLMTSPLAVVVASAGGEATSAGAGIIGS